MAARRIVIDSGGTARRVKRRFVVDSGGAARMIKRRFIIDAGGAARLTYRALYSNLPSSGVVAAANPTFPTSTFALLPNGTIQATTNSGGVPGLHGVTWTSPGAAAAEYDVRYTRNSGVTPSGATMGTWYNCSEDPGLLLASSEFIGYRQSGLTVQLRPAGGGDVLGSMILTMTAEIS